MLDKLSSKILEYMRKSEKPSERIYDFGDDIEEIAKAISRDCESVRSSVRYLQSNGYIKYVYTNSETLIGFYLDHKGLHQKELERLEQKEYIKNSIFTPILVSILTTVLTVNLWPLIMRLLKWLLSLIQ